MKKAISMLLVICMMTFALTACGSGSNDNAGANDNSNNEENNNVQDDANDVANDIADEVQNAGGTEGGKVGFVTFGLGGDFFQQLADAFVARMEADGWEAQYADGEFNPETQIAAFENYIAMGMDVIVVWSVAPEAMDGVIEQAMSQGIKVVAFVAPTAKYDALMEADNADLADNCARMAAKWIDETFADAEDHSVPVAVFSCRVADTGVVQADELIKIEEFSKKAKFVKEVELQAEDVDTGLGAMENLYTTNPEIKVFLSAHNGLAMGINTYFTAINSPVTDYSDLGIFTINGDNAVAEVIEASADNLSPMRGMVLTGSVDQTAEEIAMACNGVMDGSIEAGTVINATWTFVDAATAAEYIETGATPLTEDDYK